VVDLTYTDDNRLLVAERHENEHTILIWDGQSQSQIAALEHQRFVYTTEFLAGGTQLATHESINGLHIWDVAQASVIQNIDANEAEPKEYAISPDSSTIVWTSSNIRDGQEYALEGYDLTSQEPLQFSDNTGQGIAGLSLSSDADRVAARVGGLLQIWDARNGRLLQATDQGNFLAYVVAMDYRVDEQQLVFLQYAPFHHNVELMSLADDADVKQVYVDQGAHDMSVASERPLLAYVEASNHIVGLDLATDQVVFDFVDQDLITSLELDHAGKMLAYAGSRWDQRTQERTNVLRVGDVAERHTTYMDLELPIEIADLAFSPNDRFLVIQGYQTTTLWIWNAEVQAMETTIQSPAGPITSVAFNRESNNIAFGTETGHVIISDMRGNVLHSYADSGDRSVDALVFSPNEPLLAVAIHNDIYLFDQALTTPLKVLRGHTVSEVIHHLAYDPIQHRLISASNGGTLRVWGVQ
jgi:WD40 repeat protein